MLNLLYLVAACTAVIEPFSPHDVMSKAMRETFAFLPDTRHETGFMCICHVGYCAHVCAGLDWLSSNIAKTQG